MKLEVLKAYKTRDGEKCVSVEQDKDVFGVFHIKDNAYYFHHSDGRFVCSSSTENGIDIVSEWEEPRRGEIWVNIHSDNSSFTWDSRKAADQQQDEDRIACVRVEWVEGQGLESDGVE